LVLEAPVALQLVAVEQKVITVLILYFLLLRQQPVVEVADLQVLQ
jgi:hypothetical protein